ncbi:hypothetical protein EYZ11_000193 [Aspergillus tanneri]|uniref:Uncharacterized protein n=1 Tax=Aspergillus tanneri TaxID=1220188 RepID=A0A4S3JXM9_9EURO|nr:uncharacterized protein ATNIH1004_006450 [Aspergillus tanneri]KAA8647749.1 hypothetical protein ATNIH1004_006450 [Aspergillus tanneri]THD00300.1 hypothetical protein EYZ11_000193 [Aspergillus tanneri]
MARNELLPTPSPTPSPSRPTKTSLFFDYAANGSYTVPQVLDLLKKYQSHPAYYTHQGRPLVSTFEGLSSHSDWLTIISKTSCFFIPDWSSISPAEAANHTVIDGLFNWGAWPEGSREINTTLDRAFLSALQWKAYMKPVSPWFYTNMPARRTGSGGVIPSGGLDGISAFRRGKAPFNYARDVPHDGWRTFLPFYVEMYKRSGNAIGTGSGIPEVSPDDEEVVVWYRRERDGSGCKDGGTTENAPAQGQREYPAAETVQDRVFYSALLEREADVEVSIGGVRLMGNWSRVPDGGRGVYTGSVKVDGDGEVKVQVKRDDKVVASVKGESITSDCAGDNGLKNFNARVGTSDLSRLTSTSAWLMVWGLLLGLASMDLMS